MNVFSRYYWVLGVLAVGVYARLWELRVRALLEVGRLSLVEATRFRQLVLVGGLLIVGALVLAQVTYRGNRPLCAFYADPLRPPALIAWILIFSVLLRFGTLGLTTKGAAFLARVWPALAVSKPLDQSWMPRQVVLRALVITTVFGSLFGILLWHAIARPGAMFKC